MKKINPLRKLFVFSFCFANALIISGQTLTCETNCPRSGDMFSMRTSSPVISSIGLSVGTNKVWNFSIISSVSPSTHNISYTTASSVPTSSLYPQADLFKSQFYADGFLKIDSSGVRKVSPTTVTVNTQHMELPLPFAYGNTYTESIVSSSVSGTDVYITTSTHSFNAAASGTLILPSGTFTDVLAIKYYSTWSTTKNGLPHGYSYTNNSLYFYTPTIRQYLLYTRQLEANGPVDFGPHTEFFDHETVGVENEIAFKRNEIVVSPNPANDIVNIKLSSNANGTVFLRNSLGQLLIKQNYGADCSLNLSALPEGVYFVSFVSDNNTINKKLVVKR